MSLWRVQVDLFCVANDQPAALNRGKAIGPVARQMGFEPAGARAFLVEDRDLVHVPARAVALLERETKSKYGPAAGVNDLMELRAAVLAAYGGQLAIFDDEVQAMTRRFGYPPRDLVLERTRTALERATAPREVPAA